MAAILLFGAFGGLDALKFDVGVQFVLANSGNLIGAFGVPWLAETAALTCVVLARRILNTCLTYLSNSRVPLAFW